PGDEFDAVAGAAYLLEGLLADVLDVVATFVRRAPGIQSGGGRRLRWRCQRDLRRPRVFRAGLEEAGLECAWIRRALSGDTGSRQPDDRDDQPHNAIHKQTTPV